MKGLPWDQHHLYKGNGEAAGVSGGGRCDTTPGSASLSQSLREPWSWDDPSAASPVRVRCGLAVDPGGGQGGPPQPSVV